MSLYEKVGIRPSRSGQIAVAFFASLVVIIVIWAVVRNGFVTGVVWLIMAAAVLLLFAAWQFRGYSPRRSRSNAGDGAPGSTSAVRPGVSEG